MSGHSEHAFMQPGNAAYMLHVEPNRLYDIRTELHAIETPGGRLRYAEDYINSLADTDEWLIADSRIDTARRFSGTVVARNSVKLSEKQLEDRVRQVINDSPGGRLSSREVSDLLEVPHERVGELRRRAGIPEPKRTSQRADIALEQFHQLYVWRRPPALAGVRSLPGVRTAIHGKKIAWKS